MTTSRSAVVDTSYLVALVDSRDSLHPAALVLRRSLEEAAVRPVFFEVLVGEAISVLARRCAERRRAESVSRLLADLGRMIPTESLTWVGHEMRTWWEEVLMRVEGSQGRINFNDSLTLSAARAAGLGAVISFDPDFDGLPELVRLSTPESVQAWVSGG